MARVTIKFVVSFSSQDDNHKVSSIINDNGFNRWLSHPKEKTGQIEAIFQLEKECLIESIDVGTIWCANMELQVGKSDWAQGIPYKTLLPTVCLTSPSECKNGKGVEKTRTFTSEHFCSNVSKEKWDRIKVICRQSFRKDVQYGLTFIRIKSAGAKTPERSDRIQKNESSEEKSIVQSIQEHFFGKNVLVNKQAVDQVQSRLLKIAGTSENGVDTEQALPRTAKLVLAASENIGKYSPYVRSKTNVNLKGQLFSEHLEQKHGPKFNDEVSKFLEMQQLEDIDLDHVTIADLRHQFEKSQRRKLSEDEKKKCMDMCQNYICDLFDRHTSETENHNSLESTSRKRKAEDGLSSPKSSKMKVKDEIKTSLKNLEMETLKSTPSKQTVERNISVSKMNAHRSHLRPLVEALKKNFPKSPISPSIKSPSMKQAIKNNLNHKKVALDLKSDVSPVRSFNNSDLSLSNGWLSKERGIFVGRSVASNSAIREDKKSKVKQTVINGEKRSRCKSPVKTRGSEKEHKKDQSLPGILVQEQEHSDYIFCSNCKGNVPKHLYSHHYMTGCPELSDNSPSNKLSFKDHTKSSTPLRSPTIHSDAQWIISLSDSDSDVETSFHQDSKLLSCPICGEMFPDDVINSHANYCCETNGFQ